MRREALWIVCGQLLGALGALVGVRLLTSVIDTPSYGELSLALTGATLVSQAAIGPLGSAAERFYAPSVETGQLHQFVAALRRLVGTVSIATVIGGLVLVMVLGLSIGVSPAVAAMLATAFALFSGWETILDGAQNAARQRAVVAFHQALRPWLRSVAAMLLVVLNGASSTIALSGYVVASAIILVSQAAFWRRLISRAAPDSSRSFCDSDRLRRRMVNFALPFAWWGVFTWGHMAADRWALEWLRGPSAVGQYAVILQVGGYPLTLLGAAISQVFAPVVYARAGAADDASRTRSAFRLVAWLAVAMLLATALLTLAAGLAYGLVFHLAVGQASYQEVAPLLPLAVVSSGLFNVGQILALVPLVLHRSQALLAPKLGTAMLSVVLSAVGAQFFGLEGVLAGGVGFGMIYAMWMIVLARGMIDSPRFTHA